MFFNRGAFVLIALCAFGAIQASFEAKNGTVVDKLTDGSLIWPLHGNHSHPHHPSGPHGNQSHPGHSNSSHPSGPHGNQSHPHHPGHSNSSHPLGPHGNQSHPHHPYHPGHSNSSHPHLPPGNNSSRPFHPGHFNSSHHGYPSGKHTFISRRKNSRYPPHQPAFGFGLRPIRRRSERSIESEKQVEEIPQQRGFFSALKNIFKPSVYRRTTRVPLYRPVYRPSYQPVYRPPYNATWYRPANNSWPQWG